MSLLRANPVSSTGAPEGTSSATPGPRPAECHVISAEPLPADGPGWARSVMLVPKSSAERVLRSPQESFELLTCLR